MNRYTANYSPFDLTELIEGNFPVVDRHMKVIEAIASMRQSNDQSQSNYNYILVVEESKLVGILTERDIVKLTAAEINLAQTTVEKVMTTKLITIKKSNFDSIHSILAILRKNKIRHLPVVNEAEELKGIISVESICRALHPSNLLKFRSVSEAITKDILHAPTTASVLSLSQMMAENRKSCVIIIEEKLSDDEEESPVYRRIPVGILTERDIVQLQVLGLDMVNTIAETVMSSPLSCMKITDSLMRVREQMATLRVRRLVIVGEQGELEGIINQIDMLKVLDPKEMFGVIETLQEELEAKTKQLQREKELAQVTLQSIGDAVITADISGNIIDLNPMAEKLTGFKTKEALGSPLSKVFRIFDQNTNQSQPNLTAQISLNHQDGIAGSHALLLAQDGTEYIIENLVTPIRDNQGERLGTVIVFRDITRSHMLTEQLSWQATHDVLTGLSNRRKFEQKLIEAIALSQEKMCHHSVFYLDLDKFKIVNDTCGHAAGDQVLKEVSDIFRQQVRSSDIVARLGGDEFGILLYNCPLSKAKIIADQLLEAIDNFHFTCEAETFYLGVSIGLTEINSHTQNLASLMSTADAACYRAKKEGRNCVRVYQ